MTHAIDFLKHADRILIMKDGRIAADGSYEKLLGNPLLMNIIEVHNKNNENGENQENASDAA